MIGILPIEPQLLELLEHLRQPLRLIELQVRHSQRPTLLIVDSTGQIASHNQNRRLIKFLIKLEATSSTGRWGKSRSTSLTLAYHGVQTKQEV